MFMRSTLPRCKNGRALRVSSLRQLSRAESAKESVSVDEKEEA